MILRNLYKIIDESGKSMELITRPKSSPGFWLCLLLPMAYFSSILKHPHSTQTFEYKMSSLAIFGLCLQSMNFFVYLIIGGRFFLRMILSFLPGFITSAIFYIFLNQKISVCLFWGILYCVFYQFSFIKLIRTLPKCFTFGEAALVSQGFTLFIFNAILQIPYFIAKKPTDDFSKMNAIFMEGLFAVVIFVILISTFNIFRNTFLFYFLLNFLIAIVFFMPVTPKYPVVEILEFIIADSRRIFIIISYFGMIGISVAAVVWQVNKSEKATTSVRKIFHILLVIVYIPGLLYQCSLLYIATGVALCGIILIELMRIVEIFPFDEVLRKSFNVFADEKDAGNVALTPIYLIVGCSLPLWIHPITCSVVNDTFTSNSLLILLSGILTVGIGDTAASVFGSKLGRHKLPSSEKSFEGLIANIILQAVTVAQFYTLDLIVFNTFQIFCTAAAIIIVSLVEAYTDQVDNIVLPLVFYTIANLI